MGDTEVGKRGIAIVRVRRTSRKRQLVTLTQCRAEHRVDESACAWLSGRPRQIDGIVHDRRGRNAIEVEELIQTEPENRDDLRIQLADASLRKIFDEMIDATLPSRSEERR